MSVEIYSDGSSRGNPGPGGYGTILTYTTPSGKTFTRELSQGYRKTTNNRMELMGVIVGLETLTRPCIVQVHSDSQYVVNAFQKHWVEGWIRKGWVTATRKPVKNKDLWLRLLQSMEGHEVSFSWVKGHAGHPMNERADQLATAAADDLEHLLEDNGFEGLTGLLVNQRDK